MTSTTSTNKVYIVVARHGERWDYLQRDAGKGEEYISNADRPWDPPLSPQGLQQATRLGQHISTKLKELKLPPIAGVYASPFLRCRQTACQAVEALNAIHATKDNSDDNAINNDTMLPVLKVQVEVGLSESLNESWYRSWALPRADGTWGFVPPDEKAVGGTRRHLHEFEADELHPSSLVPAQQLLHWKPVVTHTLHDADKASNRLLTKWQDTDYASSTTIATPFALKPKVVVESKHEQSERMHQVVTNKASTNAGKTFLMVSHGGPVTHLYTKLTGNDWSVHGESKYCCYSLYECDLSSDAAGDWNPLLVNQSQYLDDLWSDATSNI